jgi:hypothetical protein
MSTWEILLVIATFGQVVVVGAGAIFAYNDLAKRLMERSYVAEIAEGRATYASHRELVVLHFFNGLGLLVHRRMVDDANIVFIIASPAMRAWKQLAPVIDLGEINARFQRETPSLRAQWESTANDLVERRLP